MWTESNIALLIFQIDYRTRTLPNVNYTGNDYITMMLEDLTKYECKYVGRAIRISQDY